MWEKFIDNNSINFFDVDNVLPYLSSMEADLAMLIWFDALTVGGEVQLTVPNTDYFVKVWQQAKWDNARLCDSESDARVAFAGLWGPQQSANPQTDGYDRVSQGVYKSGYNCARIKLLLERAGFCEIDVVSKGAEVKANAIKTMDRGERQISTRYDQIRPDHLNRYNFACDQIGVLEQNAKVLDLACGVGYGTLMLANKTEATVTGVDILESAIVHATKHFCSDKTKYVCQDAKLLSIEPGSIDAVTSFETVEHVDFDQQLFDLFFRFLKPGGLLFCSTPNQDVMPFDKEKFRYHFKHYTNAELVKLLNISGFTDVELFAQHDQKSGNVVAGDGGCFTIAVARKQLDEDLNSHTSDRISSVV